MPMPCSPRPTIIGTTVEDSAHTTEPMISGAQQTRSMRRLPYRSPRRPPTGPKTAPVSRVAVITQEALAALVSRIVGSSVSSGVTSVCMIAATM